MTLPSHESLLVGVIQTSLDYETAWVDLHEKDWRNSVKMSELEEARARKEIRHYLSSLKGLENSANVILLPELSVPLSMEKSLRRTAEAMEAIIIAGLDYKVVGPEAGRMVSNEAIIIVPRRLNGKKIARRTELKRIGKTYAAPGELRRLQSISGGPVSFNSQPNVWLFHGGDLGHFAVAICYDFMDMDRLVLYRNKIQTLFVLAYNRDINSFDHLAEALSRMIFCNVVICNCGYYGGSVAVSPFREPYLRTVYRHSGQNLPNAQLISLPLRALAEHQRSENGGLTFKSLPPGFSSPIDLKITEDFLVSSKESS